MAIYKGNNLISGNLDLATETFPLLTPHWSDHVLDHISWLRADNFSWHSGQIYTLAYNELVNEYNNATNVEICANKIGTPTVNLNGTVTNFNTNNYLTLPTCFNPGSNTWEILFKVTTGEIVSGSEYNIFSTTISTTNPGRFGTRILIGTDGLLKAFLGTSSSSWVDLATSFSPASNTTYWFKLKFTGTSYILSYSIDGVTYTDTSTSNSDLVQSFTVSYIGTWTNYNGGWNYFVGSIDLANSYIKVNNEYWWKGELCKITSKGYKITQADQEAVILNKYNEHGIAWYYILDTTNTRFKLPRTKFGFEGVRDNVGNDISESLPNITGNLDGVGNRTGFSTTSSGAFRTSSNPGYNGAGAADSNVYNSESSATFDASRSSSTYQNNAPVQERATQMYLYFYVGQFTQTAIQQTAGLNSELFNNKVDLSANNLSNAGKSLISGLSMPSNTYTSLTLGSSGATYIAPANGWFFIRAHSNNSSAYIQFYNGEMFSGTKAFTSGQELWAYLPVASGRSIIIYYSDLNTNDGWYRFGFYNARGDNS